tara:strand:+ start:203 stop:670 length:468 start_codon:yes stop_codon:yes gene_type:complete
MKYKVALLIGSESDRKTVEHSIDYFNYFGIKCDLRVMSAHRNPDDVAKFAKEARSNGYSVLIGSAGMAAHLAGALKAHSSLPVIGIPLKGGVVDGLDSLLATVQMPKGLPVATVAVGKSGAINAAILCAEILSIADSEMLDKIENFRQNTYSIDA